MHETVLTVDDEKAMLDLLSLMLTNAEDWVQTVQAGQAAMAKPYEMKDLKEVLGTVLLMGP